MTPEKPAEQIEDRESASYRNRFSLLSHDLRSALSDILGGLRLIDAGRLDPETRGHLDRIGAAGETLARLLDKTLMDEPNNGLHTITQAANLNLADFLNDIGRRWRDAASEKGIEFRIDKTTSLPAVVTLDRVSLERVIANLVGNAIKFTDTGKVILTVRCDNQRALRFKVEDDGPGFSGEALRRLFQYQGRPVNAGKPGSGLGLFIAKELSELMGAELSAGNLGTGGARAELCLPHSSWFDRSLRRDGKPQSDADNGKAKADLSGLRILLAEDNKTNQLVATQMLGALGAEYVVASDGLEALEILEREDFDLALLDIEMPRMSGLELIKAMRAKPAPLSELPLVALTAYVMREHRERIYGAGADGIIAKPLMSIEELGQAIRDYYDGSRHRAANDGDPPESAPIDADTVVDRVVFDNLVEAIGADSTAELLAKLQADTDTVAEGLVRGQKSLDLAEIRSQTHILISVAGAIGAVQLQHLAQRLNAAANRPQTDGIETMCEACLAGLAQLQGFILVEQAKADPQSHS